MLASALDPSAQRAARRPPDGLPPPSERRHREPCGGLAERRQRLASEWTPPKTVSEHRSSVGAGISRGSEAELPSSAGQLVSNEHRASSLVGSGGRTRQAAESELSRLQSDALLFAMAARRLLQSEQVSAARALLEAAPAHVLSDPVIARLRSTLAPPVVRLVDRQDADRTPEYNWLRAAQGGQYRGQWVAINGDCLLAAAPSLRELRELLRANPPDRPPLVHRVD